nr:nuclear transport factor 2 family protein [uncultured Chryseobacterium sp.]
MKLRKLIRLLGLAVMMVGCIQNSDPEKEKKEVELLHENRRKSTVDGDWKTVSSMMTDDLTFTHANAVVETKAQFIDALKTNRLQYKKLEDEQTQVRIHGNTGAVSGICHIIVDASGTLIELRVQFTEIWVKEGDGWKMLLWHATEVK